MKFSASTVRRFAILLSALCLIAMLQLTLTALQTFIDDDHIDTPRVSVIGSVRMHVDPRRSGQPFEPLTLRASADGTPEIEALPTTLEAYSVTGSLPAECLGVLWWRKVALYVYLAVTAAIIVLLLRLLMGFLQGLHTGDVFRRSAPRAMRCLALLTFIYCIIGDNFHLFELFAVDRILAGTPFSDVPLIGVTVSFGAVSIPLCMLILAEVFTVGYRLNEEESLTL